MVGGAAHAVLVERFDLPPAVVEAAAHADRVAPLDERRRALVREVVHVARRDVAAPDQEDVGHPLVGDDPGRLTAPFEHGVEAERRAVDEQADVGEIGAEGVDRGDDAAPRLRGCRRRLLEADPLGLLVEFHRVDERAADVDGDLVAGVGHLVVLTVVRWSWRWGCGRRVAGGDLVGAPAGDEPARCPRRRGERWLLGADVGGERAARPQRTAAARLRVVELASEADRLGLIAGGSSPVEARRSGEQGAGVRVPRRGEHLGGRPQLDDAAEVEDGDMVGHRADDGEVVGDEHVGAVTGRGQFADEVEDLRLHGHVER